MENLVPLLIGAAIGFIPSLLNVLASLAKKTDNPYDDQVVRALKEWAIEFEQGKK